MPAPGWFAAFADKITSGKSVGDSLGKIADQVVVTVTGSPTSTRKTLFSLAAATAFGMVQRLVPAGGKFNPLGSPGKIAVMYDGRKKEITFSITYEQNLSTVGLTTLATDVKDAVLEPFGLAAPPANPFLKFPVIQGPDDAHVGGPWDFTGPLTIRLPTPTLPFAGKTVITDQSSVRDPNPGIVGVPPVVPTGTVRPSGDARSRTSLCSLVFACLATPAESLEGNGSAVYALPTNANRFSGG